MCWGNEEEAIIIKGINRYIYGLHDRGSESLIDGKGWVVITEAIGHDPRDRSGGDYTAISDQGLGVIVRLNNGYGPLGTIPTPENYRKFAVRCGNFVQASSGCARWIIGNEPNHPQEWPEDSPIFPGQYAQCYKMCRNEILERSGHDQDLVLVAGPGPWNNTVKYATNPTGDWVQYLQDQIWGIGNFETIDGVALHTYTHGHDPSLIQSAEQMNPPFQNRYYNFWAYKDFLNGLKSMGFLGKPLFITETNGDDPNWSGGNNGWVKAAYEEIDNWNRQNPQQVIRCLVLFRWQDDPLGYSIKIRPGVQQDFKQALQFDYTWDDKLPPDPEQEALAQARETETYIIEADAANNKVITALEEDSDLARAREEAVRTETRLTAALESNKRTIEILSNDSG